MSPAMRMRLPRLVFSALIAITLLGAMAGFLWSSRTGWTPPRDAAGFVLPIYFGILLAVLTLAYVVSGNTLMHHFRTGTVQRATSPAWFWWIVAVQLAVAAVLLILGAFGWARWHG